jgi:hypothetical protein
VGAGELLLPVERERERERDRACCQPTRGWLPWNDAPRAAYVKTSSISS